MHVKVLKLSIYIYIVYKTSYTLFLTFLCKISWHILAYDIKYLGIILYL